MRKITAATAMLTMLSIMLASVSLVGYAAEQQIASSSTKQVNAPLAEKRSPFVPKMKIERPVEKLLGTPAPATPKSTVAAKANKTKKSNNTDKGKRLIEKTTEKIIISREPVKETKKEIENPVKLAVSKSTSEFKNPKVKPGKVSWHKDFETAKNAAKKSGKPVLLFQMMGNLNDRFC